MQDDAPKSRSDLGAMQELSKRPGSAASIQIYRSMIVRSGTPVMVRLLLKYASSPTTIMDFNREIQLHKQLADSMFVHKRHGSFDTEHSIYLVLDDVVGCLSFSSLRAILEGRLKVSREDAADKRASAASVKQPSTGSNRASIGITTTISATTRTSATKASIGSAAVTGANLPTSEYPAAFGLGHCLRERLEEE